MQYTSNQHKSIQDFTYIHTEGPSASYLALLALSDVPQRVGRDQNALKINTRIHGRYYIYPLVLLHKPITTDGFIFVSHYYWGAGRPK